MDHFFRPGLLLCLIASAFAADFVSTPTATDEGARWSIQFSVNEYTDVAVYAEDTLTGKILAHIAAGILGPKAPGPFLANSLSQTVYWDKRAHAGNAVNRGYGIRVGLGLRARLAADHPFYGWQSKYVMNYSDIGNILGMVVDSLGNLVVEASDPISNRRYTRMWMFDRDGQYVRTLQPYSGQLPYDKVRGFGRINMPGGRTIPVQYAAFAYSVIPELPTSTSNGLSISPQGWLVVPNGSLVHCGENSKVPRVLILGLDGSCPRDTVFGPRYPRPQVPAALTMFPQVIKPFIGTAVTRDGQNLYLALDTAVFKSALDYTGEMTPFVTLSSYSGFSKVSGLAVDASGRVYVSDWPKDRVLIYDSTGALLDSIKITRPFEVKVHPATGLVYVASADSAHNRFKLQKYSAFPALDSAATSVWITGDAYIFNYAMFPSIALDYAANPPRIWVGSLAWNYALLTCYQDNGTSFSKLTVTIGAVPGANADQLLVGGQGFLPPAFISVDPDEKVCYSGTCSINRIDLQTGAVTKSKISASQLIFSNDGQSLYGWGNGSVNMAVDSFVRRYDPRTETRIKWPNGADSLPVGSNFFYNYGASRGFCQDPRGNLYVASNAASLSKGSGQATLRLFRFSPDGTRDDTPVFTYSDAGRNAAGGFAVDREGNIFTASNMRPRGVMYPPEFAGQPFFPNIETAHEQWNYSDHNQYAFTMGSVLKFQPSGGSIITDLAVPWTTVPISDLNDDSVPAWQVEGFYRLAYKVTNATWQKFGFSGISGQGGGNEPTCGCHISHIAMDGFGRLIVPDALRFGVKVLDNNGGEILRIGEYGNADDLGGGENIPLAHPNYFTVVNKSLYISDIVNNRLVKVDLGYKTVWVQNHGIDTSWNAEVNLPPVPDEQGLVLSSFPQPFSPGAYLAFSLPNAEKVALEVYSTDGRLIKRLAQGTMRQGRHTIYWTGTDEQGRSVANGMYIAKLKAGGKQLIRNLLRIR